MVLFIVKSTRSSAPAARKGRSTANILKPALARGGLQVRKATTLGEYRSENIRKRQRAGQRFQKDHRGTAVGQKKRCMLADNIKKHLRIAPLRSLYRSGAGACVHLTQRYVPDRFFPDKAIDVMDEAGSRAHVFKVKTPEPLASMERDVETVCAERTERSECRITTRPPR